MLENSQVRIGDNGNPDLSSSAIRSIHLMLHSAFKRAQKEKLIVTTLTEDCIAPKPRKVEMKILPQEHEKHPNNLYMFPSPITGEMYHPDSVVNLHKQLLKDAGQDT